MLFFGRERIMKNSVRFIKLILLFSAKNLYVCAQDYNTENLHALVNELQNTVDQLQTVVLDMEYSEPVKNTQELLMQSTSEIVNIIVKENFFDPQTGMEMIYIPARVFLVGSDPVEDSYSQENETPQQRVFIDDFWISKTEVTNEQYLRCVEAGACEAGYYMSLYLPEEKDFPVNYVTYEQAQSFCSWIGGQLPSEFQWEKAARGTDGRIYPWGNEIPSTNKLFANICYKDSDGKEVDLLPVASFPFGASPYGVMDMSGNVWEWTSSWYSEDYYQQINSESNRSGRILKNPTGSENGKVHVIKGGAAAYTEVDSSHIYSRAANRSYLNLTSSYYVGFRCVMMKNSIKPNVY